MKANLTRSKKRLVELLNWEMDKVQASTQAACVELTQSIFDEHTACSGR